MESEPGERVETWTKSLQPPYVRVKLLEAGAPLTGGLQRRLSIFQLHGQRDPLSHHEPARRLGGCGEEAVRGLGGGGGGNVHP